MPKLKQPATLEILAVQALGRAVSQSAVEAIASGRHINARDLHEYLYGQLPDMLSQEVTAHMLAEVAGTLANGDYRKTVVSDTTKSVLLSIVCRRITGLDLSNAPMYAVKTLCCNIQTFTKLQTLIGRGFECPADVAESLPTGMSSLKFLVRFQMQFTCTDAIVHTLGSCCHATIQHIDVICSEQVTDYSLMALWECRELKRLLIFDTKVTFLGFVRFIQRDDTAKGFLGLGVGSQRGWDVSSWQLNAIALSCPMLKYLEIYALRGNMEQLRSLTVLEALTLHGGHFDYCNLDGFLRVRGCNITSVELYGTQSIDLACIVNHCVNIRRLCVEGGSVTMGNLETEACPCLESLQLFCEFSPSLIEGVLYACVNLTTLFLHPHKEHLTDVTRFFFPDPYVEHITDELILRVISKNPLQKLASFRAWCPQLTMRSLDAIVEQCPLLEELVYVYCEGMSKVEVKILQHKIESRNQVFEADSSR